MITMSKSRDLTENTPPSSSEGNTAAKVPPSLPSANTDNTPTSTLTTKKPSPNTSQIDNTGSTTLTTLPITEKARQHAMLVKVALNILVSAGLIKRYEVRSPDSTTVLKIRYEFDMAQWTEKLELK